MKHLAYSSCQLFFLICKTYPLCIIRITFVGGRRHHGQKTPPKKPSAFPFFNPLSFWHLLKLTVSLRVWRMALFSPSVRIPRYDDYVISRRVGLIRLRVGPPNFHYLKGEEIFSDFQRSSKKVLDKMHECTSQCGANPSNEHLLESLDEKGAFSLDQTSHCFCIWRGRLVGFLPVAKSGGGLTESCSLSAFSVEAGVYVLEGTE